MGYLDKMHKKIAIEKMIEQAMNSTKYKEARKKDQEQAALQAYMSFCLIACDYLQLKHGYKKRGLTNFLKFASDRLKYVEEDDTYFVSMNDYFRDELGLDVLELLGMKIEKGEDDD